MIKLNPSFLSSFDSHNVRLFMEITKNVVNIMYNSKNSKYQIYLKNFNNFAEKKYILLVQNQD